MSGFLAGALDEAKADFERKRASASTFGHSKRSKVSKSQRKDGWLSNPGARERAKAEAPSPMGLSDAELSKSRKALERKEREYKRMFNRGTDMKLRGEAADNLMVDFDRKWAEGHVQEDSEEETERQAVDNEEDPLIEIQDEFGRVRTIRTSESLRHERPVIENEAPVNLIRGPHLQTFNPDSEKKDAIWAEELASKEVHYDPSFEIRQRGTGYLNLGRGQERTQRMSNLQQSRGETLRTRGDDDQVDASSVRNNETDQIHPSRRHHLESEPTTKGSSGKDVELNSRRARQGADFLNTLF